MSMLWGWRTCHVLWLLGKEGDGARAIAFDVLLDEAHAVTIRFGLQQHISRSEKIHKDFKLWLRTCRYTGIMKGERQFVYTLIFGLSRCAGSR
jgi:hypothetical protein